MAALLLVVVGSCAFTAAAIAGDRVALVVGNADYRNAPDLNSPVHDARAMASLLKNLGFTLVGGGANENAHGEQMRRLVDALMVQLENAASDSIVLIYYSGHAVPFDNDNWLLPVGDDWFRHREDLPHNAIGVTGLLARVSARNAGANILILEACRDSSWLRSIDFTTRSPTEGLVRLGRGWPHTMVVYAAPPGRVAYDGMDGLSPFTEALLAAMGAPGQRLWSVLTEAAITVQAATRHMPAGSQEPGIGEMALGAWKPFVLFPCPADEPSCEVVIN